MQSYGNKTLGKVSLNTENVCTFDTRVYTMYTCVLYKHVYKMYKHSAWTATVLMILCSITAASFVKHK